MQAVVTTITSEGDEYAKVVAAAARRAGLRVEIDLRNEKINYKVREHSLAKIPALLVVGKKEAETHSVSVRRLGSEGQKVMPTDEADRRAGRGGHPAGCQAGTGGGGLGCSLPSDPDQRFGGNPESFMQPPDHIDRELAPAIEDFMHTIAAADKADEIARLQPVLLHVILYCLHGVRQIKPIMLALPCFHQRNQHVEPVSLARIATRDPSTPRSP